MKKILALLWIVISLLLIPSITKAAVIEGYLKEETNQSDLSNLTVKLKNMQTDAIEKETTTDSDGYFCFEDLSNGTYQVVVENDFEVKKQVVRWYEFSGDPWANIRLVTGGSGVNNIQTRESKRVRDILKYIFVNTSKNVSADEEKLYGENLGIIDTMMENAPLGFEHTNSTKGIQCVWIENQHEYDIMKKHIKVLSQSIDMKKYKEANRYFVVTVPMNNGISTLLNQFRQEANYQSWRTATDSVDRMFGAIVQICDILNINATEHKEESEDIEIKSNHNGYVKQVLITVEKTQEENNQIIPMQGQIEIVAGVNQVIQDSAGNKIEDSVKISLKDSSNNIVNFKDSSGNEYQHFITNGVEVSTKYEIGEGQYTLQYEFLENAFQAGYNKYHYGKSESEIVYNYEIETKADTFDIGKLIISKPIHVTKDTEGNIITSYDGTIDLIEREVLDLQVEIEISGVKIVLADGTVFEKKTGDLMNPINDPTTGTLKGIITMDNEIMHGATVYVEYSVKLENNGGSEAKDIKVYAYLDEEIQTFLTYDKDIALITDEQSNNETVGWNVVENPNNKLVSDAGIQDKKTVIEATFANTNESKNFIISQVITLESEAEYKASTEIVEYTQSEGQRNGTWNQGIKTSYKRAGYGFVEKEYPGTRKMTNGRIAILPPFGKSRYYAFNNFENAFWN